MNRRSVIMFREVRHGLLTHLLPMCSLSGLSVTATMVRSEALYWRRECPVSNRILHDAHQKGIFVDIDYNTTLDWSFVMRSSMKNSILSPVMAN